jgi:hypothetical protein
MREIGTFTLQIQPATTLAPHACPSWQPAHLRMSSERHAFSPECVTLDDLEDRSTACKTSWTPAR